MRWGGLGPLALALSGLTVGANAQTATVPGNSTDQYVSQGWHVGRYANSSVEHVVARGQTVFEQPLVADRLIRLDADALDAVTSERIAAAGDILFVTHASIGLVACTIEVTHKAGRIDTRYCFRDADADGRFDDFGHYLAPGGMLPIINGSYPRKPKAFASPPPYSAEQPNTGHDYVMRLVFDGKTVFGKPMLDFNVEMGRNKTFVVVDHARVHWQAQPFDAEIAGSQVRLTSIQEQVLRVEIVSPFKEEPVLIFNSAGKFL